MTTQHYTIVAYVAELEVFELKSYSGLFSMDLPASTLAVAFKEGQELTMLGQTVTIRVGEEDEQV